MFLKKYTLYAIPLIIAAFLVFYDIKLFTPTCKESNNNSKEKEKVRGPLLTYILVLAATFIVVTEFIFELQLFKKHHLLCAFILQFLFGMFMFEFVIFYFWNPIEYFAYQTLPKKMEELADGDECLLHIICHDDHKPFTVLLYIITLFLFYCSLHHSRLTCDFEIILSNDKNQNHNDKNHNSHNGGYYDVNHIYRMCPQNVTDYQTRENQTDRNNYCPPEGYSTQQMYNSSLPLVNQLPGPIISHVERCVSRVCTTNRVYNNDSNTRMCHTTINRQNYEMNTNKKKSRVNVQRQKTTRQRSPRQKSPRRIKHDKK